MAVTDADEVRLTELTDELANLRHRHAEEYLRLTAAGKGSWDAQRMADLTYGVEIARLQTKVFLTKQRIKQGGK